MSDNNPPPPAPSSQGGETKNNLDHLPVAHIIDVSGDASNASLLDALPLVLAEPGEPPTSPTIVNAWNKNTSASLDFTRLAALYDQGFSLAGSAKEADEEAKDTGRAGAGGAQPRGDHQGPREAGPADGRRGHGLRDGREFSVARLHSRGQGLEHLEES